MIVAGGGIIGLACARSLSRMGLDVTVFDQREMGAEASWAGAGMLAPGGEIDTPSEIGRMAVRSLREYASFVSDLERESGMEIDFQQCGAFDLAMNSAEREMLDCRAERQCALGIISESREWEGVDARFYPGDAIVDPRQVTAALRVSCLRSGVILREHDGIREIANDGSSVRTSRERIFDGDGVLVAAGAWSSSLCSALPRTVPVRGHLVSWSLAPGTLPSILRHGHTYLLERRNGTLIAGSSMEDAGFERAIDAEIVADIRRRAEALLPALRSMEPAAAWNGFRPAIAAPEGLACAPFIGQAGPRLWAAFGHYRNGILLAPETARIIQGSVAAALGA